MCNFVCGFCTNCQRNLTACYLLHYANLMGVAREEESVKVGSIMATKRNLLQIDSNTFEAVPLHNRTVYNLVSASEDDYTVPECPFQMPVYTNRVEFGAAMKKKHFFLDRDWTYLNHGAFGATLREGMQVTQAWQVHCEQQPTRYFDREFLNHMAYSLRRLAKFVDSDPTDLALVKNVTAGTFTVLQGMVKTFQPGDSIFALNTTYGAVKIQLDRVSKENGIPVDEVVVKFPIDSPDEILKVVRESLRPDTKLAVFDHVCSSHGMILPVKELVKICHEKGIPVLIDGAHCFGSLPISMREIGADFYVANGHKWLCTSKGCAFLYVSKKYQSIIRPLITSWGYGNGFTTEFGFSGTNDYSPYLSLITVLDFWEFYGPDNIREYLYKTIKDAAKLLTEAWGTRIPADPSMFGTMVLVELPDGLLPRDSGVRVEPPFNDKSASKVENILHYDYKIEVPLKCIDGKLYVRISAHIYNEMKDYERLAEAVLEQRSKLTNN